jgi:2'-5' RNA ligase
LPHTRWFWGVVARLDVAEDVLRDVGNLTRDQSGIIAQDHRTGHITLLYAPLRGRRAGDHLAEAVAETAKRHDPFDIAIAGFGEFTSPDRSVAWLGVERGGEEIDRLRAALCRCESDKLPHRFVPHLTLLYGEDTGAYDTLREPLTALVDRTRLEATVDAVWVAGFPQSGHPARDLRYVARIPLGS